ncbi:MAG: inorganic diphosphatase [Verrucomicrobia bacterium]|nr:inorganic diphosphatase [Verrucomicrobiota bacterium]MDA0906207.1 inorganic diphosphatase [Verrucomicrobiota bacterium]
MKLGLFLIPLTLFSISEAKPTDNSGLLSKEDTLRFRIEIPAGTKQKWEFNFETGEMEKDYKDGKERIIQFLPYPGNYGFIPETLAGDGDPIDVIDLDEAGERGDLKEVRIIGALNFEDKEEADIKFIGVSPSGTFGHIQSIEQLLLEKPAVLEILKSWFLNYKKPGKMVFYGYMDRDSSIQLIIEARKKWKPKN